MAPLRTLPDCWMLSMRWMSYWSTAVAMVHAGMLDLSALRGVPLDVHPKVSSVAGLWSQLVCKRSFVMGLFTKLNRWPILWLWPEVLMPPMQPLWWPYGHACWLLMPLVPPSLPMTCCVQSLTPRLLSSGNHVLSGSFCETGVTLNWWVSAWNTPILQWFPFATGLETSANIWVPAAVSTCIHFNLVHQCYHCCELGLYFHPKVYYTGQDWLSVSTCWLLLIIGLFNSLLLSCQSFCKFVWHPC